MKTKINRAWLEQATAAGEFWEQRGNVPKVSPEIEHVKEFESDALHSLPSQWGEPPFLPVEAKAIATLEQLYGRLQLKARQLRNQINAEDDDNA